MAIRSGRRAFIKRALLAPAAVAALQTSTGFAAEAALAQPVAPGNSAPVESGLPCGKIGNLAVSRLLLGGNLLTHYTHSRDLQYVYTLCAHYNTEQKILDTLKLAEQNGINTLVVHTAGGIVDILKKHRHEQGGKMQWIICPTAEVAEDMSAYTKMVRELADNGTDAIYLWGVTADRLLGQGKVDLIAKAVDVAKEQGVPSGVGAHDLNVVIECEKAKVGADFYIKTFHHHEYPSAPKSGQISAPTSESPAYWCRNPQDVIDVMKGVEKPWIAFKVMAAGAIPPKDAFHYAFTHGADHVLAGMFDFEIAEDVSIARELLANVNRERPWRS
ncbi:MAG: hypothetical protein NTU83_06385 [Candidatus Hydrogenedentes bacterium]|nr:hypothetical protein [Candidatus Hydrogenedentota bacterium]